MMQEAEERPLARPRRGMKGRATEQDVLVGRRLKAARELAGLTQEQLGAVMGVSFQAVQKYECGENRLSVERLKRAIDVLGRPVSYFFGGDDVGAQGLMTRDLTPQEALLIRNFRGFDEPLRKHLVDLTTLMRRQRVGSGGGSR